MDHGRHKLQLVAKLSVYNARITADDSIILPVAAIIQNDHRE